MRWHIGTRHGEKIFEVLLSCEERASAEDLGKYFKILPDGRDLNYGKYVDAGEQRLDTSEEYNSHNTERLDLEGMKRLLQSLDFMQRLMRDGNAVADD